VCDSITLASVALSAATLLLGDWTDGVDNALHRQHTRVRTAEYAIIRIAGVRRFGCYMHREEDHLAHTVFALTHRRPSTEVRPVFRPAIHVTCSWSEDRTRVQLHALPCSMRCDDALMVA
jgi:hypothetical protein